MALSLQAAQAAYDVGDFVKCIAVSHEAVMQKNADPQFLFLLSSALRRMGKYREARKVLVFGAVRFPRHQKFSTALSEVEYILGNGGEALDAAKLACDQRSGDARSLAQLALSYALVGDMRKALESKHRFDIVANGKNSNNIGDAIDIAKLWHAAHSTPAAIPIFHSAELIEYSNSLSEDALHDLAVDQNNGAFRAGTIIGADGPIENKDVRNVKVLLLSPKSFSSVYESIYQIAHHAAAKLEVSVFPDGPLQLVQYEGDSRGHYSWHQDIGPGRHELRRFTVVTGVSRLVEYSGGSFQIESNNIQKNFAFDRGDALVFASKLKHRVCPVLNGVRLTVVGWFRSTQ